MIIVAGHIRVAGSNRTIFLEGSTEAVRLARGKSDCLDFTVSADVVDPERVNVYERWVNRSALMTFRGEGPSDALNALIISSEVQEFEVLFTDDIFPANPPRAFMAGDHGCSSFNLRVDDEVPEIHLAKDREVADSLD